MGYKGENIHVEVPDINEEEICYVWQPPQEPSPDPILARKPLPNMFHNDTIDVAPGDDRDVPDRLVYTGSLSLRQAPRNDSRPRATLTRDTRVPWIVKLCNCSRQR